MACLVGRTHYLLVISGNAKVIVAEYIDIQYDKFHNISTQKSKPIFWSSKISRRISGQISEGPVAWSCSYISCPAQSRIESQVYPEPIL